MARRALLVGESWITHETHIKGVDSFTNSTLVSGAGPFLSAVGSLTGWEVEHLMGHDVPRAFPSSEEEIAQYSVIILSDIGSRSLAIHPETWGEGKARPDRLALVQRWVEDGGGLAMIGGYLSFQGLNGTARYRGTPVAEVLPVVMGEWDDCVERPAGARPKVLAGHALVEGLGVDWPALLGYNRVSAREGATVLCTVDDSPLLVVGHHGRGRALAWTSDIGPHWCPREFLEWDGYGKLWRQAVKWLGNSHGGGIGTVVGEG